MIPWDHDFPIADYDSVLTIIIKVFIMSRILFVMGCAYTTHTGARKQEYGGGGYVSEFYR